MIRRGIGYIRGTGLGPRLVKAVSGSSGVHLAGMGLTFLVGVQLARGLGAERYGVYGVAMSVIALITIPTQFGLPPLLTREVASAQAKADPSKLHAVVKWSTRTVVLISAVEAALVLAAVAVFRQHIGGPVTRTLLFGLPLVPFVALGNLRGAALRGLQHIVKGQLPEHVVRPAVFALLLLCCALWSDSTLTPGTAIALHAVAAALSLAAGTWMLRRLLPPNVAPAGVSSTARSAWLASSIPMALTQGARVLQGHLVILLLGVLSASAVVGVYRVSTAVSLSVATPVALLNVVAAPFFARLHAQGDLLRLRRMLGWVAGAMLLGVTALSAPFLVAGEDLLALLFGPEFAGSNAPLLVLCLGVVMSAAMGANSALLNMTGHEKYVTRAFFTSLATLAVLSPPLILALDALGAAAAQSVAVAVWNVLLWRHAKTRLGVDTSVLALFPRRANA